MNISNMSNIPTTVLSKYQLNFPDCRFFKEDPAALKTTSGNLTKRSITLYSKRLPNQWPSFLSGLTKIISYNSSR